MVIYALDMFITIVIPVSLPVNSGFSTSIFFEGYMPTLKNYFVLKGE